MSEMQSSTLHPSAVSASSVSSAASTGSLSSAASTVSIGALSVAAAASSSAPLLGVIANPMIVRARQTSAA